MISKLLIPRLSVNDNTVLLGRWLVADGAQIDEGQAVAVLETSKETVEWTAPRKGFIKLVQEEGTELEVGEIFAFIADDKSETIKFDTTLNFNDMDNAIEDPRKYTEKAKQLILLHHIDINLLPTDHIIREKDVLTILETPYQIEETTGNQVIIYGGGGFAHIIIDILKQKCAYQLKGIIDMRYPEAEGIMGVPVIGNNDSLDQLHNAGIHKAINAVGPARKSAFQMLKEKNFDFPNIIHTTSIIEPSATMGVGNLICAGATIGSEVKIGSNCVINAGAIISHECIISDHCHIASGAVIAGCVTIGENTLIGQSCTIYSRVKIGKNVTIQNGCHIFKDVRDGETVKAK